MNPLGLIIKREYLHRVSKKSFLLLTILTPFLFAAMVFVPLWLSSIKGDTVHKVAVIDQVGKYNQLFEDSNTYTFVSTEEADMEAYRKSDDKDIFAFVHITGDLLVNPDAITIYSHEQVPRELRRMVENMLNKALSEEKMTSFNIPNLKEIIKESQVDISVQTIKWGEDGTAETSSAEVASLVGMVFTLIIYMFILTYGAMVMQSVLEEKTNRIVEIIVSSVRPFDLMLGKIISIGMVGLTQFFVWSLMTGFIILCVGLMMGMNLSPEMLSASTPEMTNAAAMSMLKAPEAKILGTLATINFTEIALLFVVYFVGGYLLYASVLAAIGAMVDNQEDTQQFMVPIILLVVFALYAGIYSVENPDGPLAFWASMIPLTSPIVMMVRLPFDVSLWEVLLSVVILYGTALGITALSARIYRVGILMYGKKPNMKEIWKWLKYK